MGMHKNSMGKKILGKALVDRFVIVDDSNYDSIRKMNDKANKTGYKAIY